MKKIFYPLLFLISVYFLSLYYLNINSQNNQWKYLFNGKNLDGWEIKINGYELGDNHKNTLDRKSVV